MSTLKRVVGHPPFPDSSLRALLHNLIVLFAPQNVHLSFEANNGPSSIVLAPHDILKANHLPYMET